MGLKLRFPYGTFINIISHEAEGFFLFAKLVIYMGAPLRHI